MSFYINQKIHSHPKAYRKEFKRGEALIHRGECADHVYLIESGSVKIFVADDAGKEVKLLELSTGDSLCKQSSLFSKPCQYSAACNKGTIFKVIDSADFKKMYQADSTLAYELNLHWSDRVFDLTQHFKAIALDDIPSQIEWAVKNRQCRTSRPGEIASYLRTARETVSRRLNHE